jgi:Omp85 superfamily domain
LYAAFSAFFQLLAPGTARACGVRMKLAWGGILFAMACLPGTLIGRAQDSEFNVNTRYTVETVLVRGDGWSTNLAASGGADDKISSGLRRQITALIGDKLNPALLDELAAKLRKEFQARTVTHRVLRGTTPEYVQVLFEIKVRPTRFDVSVPKFAYNSVEGFSGGLEATATIAQQHAFTFGIVSDGDDLVERYSGVVARYEDNHLGSDRVRAEFEFATYHELWNPSTRDALAGSVTSGETSGLYRTRQDIEPGITFVLAKPLTLTVGAGFEEFQDSGSAQTEAANAITSSLTYRRQFEDADFQQNLDAGYDLRAATKLMASDFAYLRHHWLLHYVLTHGKHVLSDRLIAGMLVGRAPLFERFVLGNSTTLRGWNRYEFDPLGGNRVVHNSVEYRYGWFESFYDAGAVWDAGRPITFRHSVGAGVHQGPVFLAVAFPLRSGRMDPVFMVNMNY